MAVTVGVGVKVGRGGRDVGGKVLVGSVVGDNTTTVGTTGICEEVGVGVGKSSSTGLDVDVSVDGNGIAGVGVADKTRVGTLVGCISSVGGSIAVDWAGAEGGRAVGCSVAFSETVGVLSATVVF